MYPHARTTATGPGATSRPVRRRGPLRRIQRSRRSVVLVLALALTAAVAAGPAAAQTTSPTTDPAASERAERDQTASERARTEAELDTLTATDVELKAELARIDGQIDENERRADEARVQRDAALAELDDLRTDVARAEEAERRTRRMAAERAVASYMRPGGETASQLLTAEDPDELGRMRVLLSQVAEYDHDVLTNHQTARVLLEQRRTELSDAEARLDAAVAQAEASTAELTTLRDERATVSSELDDRIEHLRGEVAALEAQEAQLTSLIAARQAAATTTTTTAPSTTTTTAAPSTTGAGGGVSSSTTTTTASTTTTTRAGGISLSWPVSGTLTSPFGPRWGVMHRGIDIAAPSGTPISASAAGTVFFAGSMGGYGNVVLIDHGNGIVTLYAHQSSVAASNGQSVSRGQTIGYVGSTGHSTGPHLHFEVRVNGTAVDPMGYLG